MKKINLHLTCCLAILNLIVLDTQAQEILLKGEPAVIEEVPKWGPNRTNYLQTGIYYGLFIPRGDINNLAKELLSGQMELSAQYKRKASPWLAFVGEVAYERLAFRVGLEEISWLDDSYYKQEKIILDQLSSALFMRINPDINRGNILGKYIEAGIFMGYVLADRQVGRRTLESPGKKEKITRTNLNYTVPFHYGLLFRFGWNQYVLYYRINLTEIFDPEWTNHLLPLQSIGIGLKLGN